MNIKRKLITKVYNPFISFFKGNNKEKCIQSSLKEFEEIKHKVISEPGAISDHLVTLYIESLKVKPQLIVELGVRGGASTFVMEKIAKRYKSNLVSVDIEDCLKVIDYDRWYFIKKDDIDFSEIFGNWCERRKIYPEIDLLFIDSSHHYEHTKKEIESWFPFLSAKGKIFLHDTNMGELYQKKDHTIGFGWDNNRGVIKALEDYFDERFDETRRFIFIEKDWIIEHYPYGSGFTILTKI